MNSTWGPSWLILTWKLASHLNSTRLQRCGFEESNYSPRSPVFSQCRYTVTLCTPFFLVQLHVLPGILMVQHHVLRRLLLEIPTNLAVKRSYFTVDSIIPNDHQKKTPLPNQKNTTSQVPSDPTPFIFPQCHFPHGRGQVMRTPKPSTPAAIAAAKAKEAKAAAAPSEELLEKYRSLYARTRQLEHGQMKDRLHATRMTSGRSLDVLKWMLMGRKMFFFL